MPFFGYIKNLVYLCLIVFQNAYYLGFHDHFHSFWLFYCLYCLILIYDVLFSFIMHFWVCNNKIGLFWPVLLEYTLIWLVPFVLPCFGSETKQTGALFSHKPRSTFIMAKYAMSVWSNYCSCFYCLSPVVSP